MDDIYIPNCPSCHTVLVDELDGLRCRSCAVTHHAYTATTIPAAAVEAKVATLHW